MRLTDRSKAVLLAHAERVADDLIAEYGRARIGGVMYSAADLSHGGFSVVVTGMTDDVERRQVTVYLDGTCAASEPTDAGGAPLPAERAGGVTTEIDGLTRPGARSGGGRMLG
jgi:hypothetical protein